MPELLITGQCHVPRARLRRALLRDRSWRPEEAAAQEFREDGVGGSGAEKFREARAERVRDDEFGRRALGVHRAHPAPEELPDGRAARERQVLQQALCDTPELDVAVVGREFAAHLLAIPCGTPVHVLVAAHVAARRHRHHPEVVGVAAHDAHGVAEAEFDLEPVAVEDDHVERVHGDVARQEHEVAVGRVPDEDEADDAADGPPEEVDSALGDRDVGVPVDGARHGRERGGDDEQIA